MSDSLKNKLDKNLAIIKEKYPNFLGVTDKRQIEVDKFNGKFNLSVGIDSLSPPTTLKVLVECSDSIRKTLEITSKFVDNITDEKEDIDLNELRFENESLKEQLDNISNRHLRETQTILTERDNEKQDNIRLLKENKALTDRLGNFTEQYEQLWDQHLIDEQSITIMQDNCPHKKECLNIPKKHPNVIDARKFKIGEENY